MKNVFAILVTTLVLFSCEKKSDESMVLQPGPEDGIDALVWSISSGQNYANYPELNALAWTYESIPAYMRAYLKFDLSSISPDKTVRYAALHLYGINSAAHGTHQSLTGANYSLLCRVNEPWQEATLSWSNMPSFGTANAVLLDSCNTMQDYVIDVTAHVNEMVQNPEENYGWVIKQQSEVFYRKMIFASSDHEDEALRPKLVVEVE